MIIRTVSENSWVSHNLERKKSLFSEPVQIRIVNKIFGRTLNMLISHMGCASLL